MVQLYPTVPYPTRPLNQLQPVSPNNVGQYFQEKYSHNHPHSDHKNHLLPIELKSGTTVQMWWSIFYFLNFSMILKLDNVKKNEFLSLLVAQGVKIYNSLTNWYCYNQFAMTI